MGASPPQRLSQPFATDDGHEEWAFFQPESARIGKNRKESARIGKNRLIAESTSLEGSNFVIANEGMPVEGPNQHTSQHKATQIGAQTNVV